MLAQTCLRGGPVPWALLWCIEVPTSQLRSVGVFSESLLPKPGRKASFLPRTLNTCGDSDDLPPWGEDLPANEATWAQEGRRNGERYGTPLILLEPLDPTMPAREPFHRSVTLSYKSAYASFSWDSVTYKAVLTHNYANLHSLTWLLPHLWPETIAFCRNDHRGSTPPSHPISQRSLLSIDDVFEEGSGSGIGAPPGGGGGGAAQSSPFGA